jgi:hypothetical protein
VTLELENQIKHDLKIFDTDRHADSSNGFEKRIIKKFLRDLLTAKKSQVKFPAQS